jgi:hypothetical protein
VRREFLRLRADNRKKTPRKAAKIRVYAMARISCEDFEEHATAYIAKVP